MKVAFYTLGCKVNAYETEAIMELFQTHGYEIVDYQDVSDVYVINSCMVTNSGERKSKQIIRRPMKLNPKAVVIVMGCLSQIKAKEMLKIPGVKIVLGTKNRHLIIDYLNEYLLKNEPLDYSEPLAKNEAFENLSVQNFKHHQRAFVKIQDGCNNFCTYCIIPYTRGRIRSKDKDLILEEVQSLVLNGHKEIVLTGIHTGGYGEDLGHYSFADLLSELESVDGLKRVRISSIEITELNADVLSVIQSSKKIVNHLHIPLQSGSNIILKLMNRKYDQSAFLDKINEIRDTLGQIAITTDVIVGFPGETDDDFQEAYDFIQLIGFQEIHVFPYSMRQGTPAAKMKHQVDGAIKKERVHRLLELSDQLKLSYYNQQIGSFKEVIIEQEKDGWLMGHSNDYVSIKLKGQSSLLGEMIQVKLIEMDFPSMIGIII
jgi:threonylcarbamoyladenosine tRNA methylthiotransferase MtaB